MKKVLLITILDNTNYGTYLQALATSVVVRNLGYEVEVIRYIRPCQTPHGQSMRILRERGLLRWINRCVLHGSKETWILRDKDYEFLQSFVPVTRQYTSFSELQRDVPEADIYLTGSDQVWNSVYNDGIDRSFYLDFAPAGKKRIAYAASIGMDKIPDEEREDMRSLLQKYAHITVREQAAVSLLSSVGIKSQCVLDPTLLLTHSQWSDIAEKYPCKFDEPFLLVYSVELKSQNRLIEKYAKEIAEKKGLKIYHVSYSGSRKNPAYPDRHFNYATPDVFLNLMLNASFVVISSFHGTAFSINFNKQFLTVAPARFSSRVQSLLEKAGLSSRLVHNNSFSTTGLEDIDYMAINPIIQEEREKSLCAFKSILDN